MNAVKGRRSIRKYQNRDVSDEMILEIIEAGRLALSAKNRQPWKYVVFTGESKKELLGEMEKGIDREENVTAFLPDSRNGLADAKYTLKVMYEAPAIIIVMNTNGKDPFVPLNTDGRITEICDTLSIGASVENMLLRAAELNIGTLWIANTCFAYKELTEYLGEKGQLTGAIALGYPDETPNQRPRKMTEEIVEFRR